MPCSSGRCLAVRRDELTGYLDALDQPYRHDPSNADPRFTRNRIRHQLLPRLQRHFNAEVVESLLRLGTLAGEAQAVIDELVDQWFDRCVAMEGPNEVRIALGSLAGQAALPRPRVADGRVAASRLAHAVDGNAQVGRTLRVGHFDDGGESGSFPAAWWLKSPAERCD